MKGPLRINATYQVTTWARAREDEHRLLWRVLAALVRHPVLPDEALVGQLREQPFPVPTLTGQPETMPANIGDLWSALDNRIRPAIAYVVTLALDPELAITSPVLLQEPRLGVAPTDRDEAEHGLTIRGRVRDRADAAQTVGGALVVIRETGQRAQTDDEGRFQLGGVLRGRYTLVVRAPGRAETEQSATAPGPIYELEV
jgi:hypothetical protein